MANCSIPNSTPANGRISTTSSRRSKRPSNYRIAVASLVRHFAPHPKRNIQHPTSNTEFEKQQRAGVRRSALDVQCSTFSFFRRVKGAWWPSRSSKPSSSRKWRGRFDSYPLRHSFCSSCSRFAVRNARVAHRATATTIVFSKGGDLKCPVSKSEN
jgi:hypothetical protein